jgi:hypothetical protein
VPGLLAVCSCRRAASCNDYEGGPDGIGLFRMIRFAGYGVMI